MEEESDPEPEEGSATEEPSFLDDDMFSDEEPEAEPEQ